jgi:hypothetical protein
MDKQTLIDAFGECFEAGGSSRIECGACGRTFSDLMSQGDFEDGELDELIAKAEKNPNYCQSRDGYVHWMMYNGVAIVSDCPCGQAEKIALGLWHERRRIARFLKKAVDIQSKNAETDADIIDQLETGESDG